MTYLDNFNSISQRPATFGPAFMAKAARVLESVSPGPTADELSFVGWINDSQTRAAVWAWPYIVDQGGDVASTDAVLDALLDSNWDFLLILYLNIPV